RALRIHGPARVRPHKTGRSAPPQSRRDAREAGLRLQRDDGVRRRSEKNDRMVPGEPLKICFFNRSYWPDQAATGQLLTELAEDLVNRHGCEVTVVAGRALHGASGDGVRLWPIRRESHHGVAIVRANGTRFRPRRFSGRAANYVTYFASSSLASLLVGRPDVVVSLTDPPIVGLAALATARRAGARFVFLCEDIFPEVASVLDDFHNAAVNRTLDRINRRLLHEADAVVALGDRMKRRLVDEKGADASRVHVIHNWADCRAIAPAGKD